MNKHYADTTFEVISLDIFSAASQGNLNFSDVFIIVITDFYQSNNYYDTIGLAAHLLTVRLNSTVHCILRLATNENETKLNLPLNKEYQTCDVDGISNHNY
jgi:hypothetical protein